MAEIVPDSTITLLFNVPLNNKYDNTYYFSSINEQANFFFSTFSKQTFTQQSYQRKNRGWLRLSARYRDVFNANYMYFMNNFISATSHVSQMVYEQKQFYAFITQVNYINDMTVEIQYEIDVIQSYMFNWTLPQCMVERETVDGDSLYKNYIDEGIPVSDYANSDAGPIEFTATIDGVSRTYPLGRMKYVVAATFDRDFHDTTDGVPITQDIKGAVCGCKFIEFDDASACIQWLNLMPGEKYGGVLGIYMLPVLISLSSNAYNTLYYNLQYSKYDYYDYYTSFTPKNKKMYHSPYCSLVIQNSEGASMAFDPTQFWGSASFTLHFSPVLPITGYLSADYYKVKIMPSPGIRGTNSPFLYSLPLPSLPTFTWANDTYKAWLALNSGYMQTAKTVAIIDTVVDTASGIRNLGALGAAAALGTVIGGPIGAAAGTVSAVGSLAGSIKSVTSDLATINNLYTQDKNAQIVPDSFNGSADNQATALAGTYGFYSYVRFPTRDVAVSIDNYFTMFGYKVREIKVPSLNNRTRFTYVKTLNMDVEGFIPTDDRDAINNIFNAGIRFWKDKTNFCDYSITNECNNPVVE